MVISKLEYVRNAIKHVLLVTLMILALAILGIVNDYINLNSWVFCSFLIGLVFITYKVPFGNALNVTLNALLASDQQKMNVLVANQRNFYSNWLIWFMY